MRLDEETLDRMVTERLAAQTRGFEVRVYVFVGVALLASFMSSFLMFQALLRKQMRSQGGQRLSSAGSAERGVSRPRRTGSSERGLDSRPRRTGSSERGLDSRPRRTGSGERGLDPRPRRTSSLVSRREHATQPPPLTMFDSPCHDGPPDGAAQPAEGLEVDLRLQDLKSALRNLQAQSLPSGVGHSLPSGVGHSIPTQEAEACFRRCVSECPDQRPPKVASTSHSQPQDCRAKHGSKDKPQRTPNDQSRGSRDSHKKSRKGPQEMAGVVQPERDSFKRRVLSEAEQQAEERRRKSVEEPLPPLHVFLSKSEASLVSQVLPPPRSSLVLCVGIMCCVGPGLGIEVSSECDHPDMCCRNRHHNRLLSTTHDPGQNRQRVKMRGGSGMERTGCAQAATRAVIMTSVSTKTSGCQRPRRR